MTINQDDERFAKVLIERGYLAASIRKLRDGSWTASLRQEESLWETHTGVDVYGPRVRYVFDSMLHVINAPDQLSSVNDEPTGWIKRIPVPRYFAIKKLPKGEYKLGVLIGSPQETGYMKSCEVFLDDKDGRGMVQFLARVHELRLKDKLLQLCENLEGRNWNPIHHCFRQDKTSS